MRFLIAILVLLLMTPSWAHQQKEAYITVLFNPRTGNIEVNHRYYIHDAEHAIGKILSVDADIYSSKETQQKFSDYLQTQFKVTNLDDIPVALTTVGFEVEGKYFWSYQEVAIPENIQGLKFQMKALQEVWPKQINQINVERNKQVQSVRLAKGDDWKTIRF